MGGAEIQHPTIFIVPAVQGNGERSPLFKPADRQNPVRRKRLLQITPHQGSIQRVSRIQRVVAVGSELLPIQLAGVDHRIHSRGTIH
ncbi:hypothetical protein D3C73_1356150 [compost metagenome]